jgi:LemA protein
MSLLTLSIGAVAAAAVVWAMLAFNRLVRTRNLVRAGLSDIDVQLQRRHDLVPRLVEAVRAYAGHERSVLREVTEARARAEGSRAEGSSAVAERDAAERALAGGIGRLVLLAEDYPDLKAGESFRQLMADLVEVEGHLQHARRFYNGAVRELNTRIERFPDLVVARLAGFREAEFFSAGIEARTAPDVARPLAGGQLGEGPSA